LRETCIIVHSVRAFSIRVLAALGLTLLLALSPLAPRAAEMAMPQEPAPQQAGSSLGEDLGYGVGSVLVSLFYSPAKITYAGLGLLTGGLGFVLSAGNTKVANNIINPAVRGNYVVTPRHLRGEESLIFVGPDNHFEPAPQQTGPTASIRP